MRSRRPSVHEISVGDIELEGVPDFRSDPLADSIASSDLRRVLESLDPTDRALIALRYVAELSSDEIGRALGMSSSGARGRLSRLLLRLRGELRDDMTSTSSSGASPRPFVPTPTRALVRSRQSRSPVPRSPAPSGELCVSPRGRGIALLAAAALLLVGGAWRRAPASCGCRRSSRRCLPHRSAWSPRHRLMRRPRPERPHWTIGRSDRVARHKSGRGLDRHGDDGHASF